MGCFVHETAYVDEGARIGDRTKVWHFSHVMSGAEIGTDCSLGQNVFIGKKVRIGNQVKIQNNVSVFEGVILEDYVFCGPGATFTNVRTPRSAFPRNTADYLPTRVKMGATLGANATVICGVTIGQWALVAAGAVVARDVPDYRLVAGVPAREIGWACQCGATLVFEGDNTICGECQRVYQRQGSSVIHILGQERHGSNC